MTTRVVVDGMPNEPVAQATIAALVTPILDLFGGLDPKDVASLHIDSKAVRAKVLVRNKRGRRLVDSWSHLVVRITPEEEA